jgi:putative DNA primase/helicase
MKNKEIQKHAEKLISEIEKRKIPDEVVLEHAYQDERGDAKLLAEVFCDDLAFDVIKGNFIEYRDGIWREDELRKIQSELIDVLVDIYSALSRKMDEKHLQIIQIIQEKAGSDDELQKKAGAIAKVRDFLRRRITKLNTKNRISNVISLLKPEISVSAKDFDVQPFLFNLRNGTYNFKTNVVQLHNPHDKLQKVSPVLFDKDKKALKWLDFLNIIFCEDSDLIDFVQKCVGYSLTGYTDIQSVFFCYGKGANGKSTFFSTLRLLAGDYYDTITIDSILSGRSGNNNTQYEMSKLKGKRLIVASEIPENRKLNESQLKDLTGGEAILARNPFEKPFSFQPTHKLWLFGNHKPVIAGTDNGIWRRIRLIPFSATIPPEKQRKMSDIMKEFHDELSGILNWALEGYRKFQEEGLEIPRSVEAATEEYRKESDFLSDFFQVKCEMKGKTLLKELFQEYEKWCAEEKIEIEIKDVRKMSKALKDRGFLVEAGTGNKTIIHNISLILPIS